MKTTRLLLLFCLLALPAHAASRSWNGSVSGFWNNPTNWTPTGIPANGEDLILPQSAVRTTQTNNLSNLRIRSLTFEGTPVFSNDILYGNSITLSNGIICLTNQGTVNLPITLAGDQTFSLSGSLTLGDIDVNGFTLTLDTHSESYVGLMGGISGSGHIIASGDSTTVPNGGLFYLGGSNANTFAGTFSLKQGNIMVMGKLSGPAIIGLLEAEPNTYVEMDSADSFSSSASFQMKGATAWDFAGRTGSDHLGSLGLYDGGPTNTMFSIADGITYLSTALVAMATNKTARIEVFTDVQPTGALGLTSIVPFQVAGPAYPALDIRASIVGPGGFTKYGSGTLRLSAVNGSGDPVTNTFSGSVVIYDGNVEALSSKAFGSTSGGVTLAGGSVTLQGVAIGAEPLIASNATPPFAGSYMNATDTSSWAGPINLKTNLVLISGHTTTLSGAISGGGGLDLQYDTVVLSGSSANTFTGPTYARGALLMLSKPLNTKAVGGPLFIGGGTEPICEVFWSNTGQLPALAQVTLYTNGVVSLSEKNDTIDFLTFNGGTVALGSAGNLTLSGSVTGNPTNVTAVIDGATVAGGIFLSANVDFNIGDGPVSTDLEIYSRINGPFGFTKSGAGSMTLDGNNTFTGQTVVQGGTLTVTSDAGLGSTSGGTVVNSNAVLELRSAAVGAEPLTLNSTGRPGYGALWVELGNSSWAGGILLSNDATVRVESGNTLTVSGVISGPSQLLKDGPGTLLLNHSTGNTYTNVTHVVAGTLELLSASGDTIPGPLIIENGVVQLLGSGEIATVPVTVNGSSLLDLNGFSDNIGSLTLNTGGDVTTGAGLLTLGGDLFASAGGSVFSPDSCSISGKLSLGAANRTINVPNNVISSTELTISAIVSGNSGSGIFKVGTGTMRLSGNNTFTGQLTINTGQVVLASSTAFGVGGGVNVNNNSVLSIDGSLNLNGNPLTLNSVAAASLTVISGTSVWNSTVALAKDTTVNVTTNASLVISNSMSGPGALTLVGPGTLALGGSNANTCTNVTIINAGTLVLSNRAVNQTLVGNVVVGDGVGGANADVLRLGRNNQISDTSAVTLNSSGLFDLNGFTETVGAIAGAGNIALGASGDLTVNHANVVTFDGVISGNGTVTKQGTGKLTFTGNNNAGTLFVNGGTVLVNGSQPASPVTVNLNGTLGGSGTVGNLTVSSGTLSPGNSPGILTCGSLTLIGSASFIVELNGTNAGSGYDQMNVRGAVNLGNTAILKASLGFASAVSNKFTIINNDGVDAVTGTFNGLPEDATLNISGIPFRISYAGGSGNDVVLTQLLPLPTMSTLRTVNTNLVLLWPTNYTGFTLESNTNLGTATWATVVPAPVVNGTNYVVTNSLTGSPKFFRLRSP